ncbi:hypothetical protein NW752_007587 [Fusarium irregulare]|nr:hypothetical protein NW752_007587 [Fusarium irregulare]
MSGSKHRIAIHFEGIDSWEDNREMVDKILEEDTGTFHYPATRSLPPIIFGPEVSQEACDKLKGLDGVTIKDQGDD